ncbi:MAG: hypothetical protein ACI93T_003803, partial [Porticoccaceae bacterium]
PGSHPNDYSIRPGSAWARTSAAEFRQFAELDVVRPGT